MWYKRAETKRCVYLDNDILVTQKVRHGGGLHRRHLRKAHGRHGVEDPWRQARRQAVPCPGVSLGLYLARSHLGNQSPPENKKNWWNGRGLLCIPTLSATQKKLQRRSSQKIFILSARAAETARYVPASALQLQGQAGLQGLLVGGAGIIGLCGSGSCANDFHLELGCSRGQSMGGFTVGDVYFVVFLNQILVLIGVMLKFSIINSASSACVGCCVSADIGTCRPKPWMINTGNSQHM